MAGLDTVILTVIARCTLAITIRDLKKSLLLTGPGGYRTCQRSHREITAREKERERERERVDLRFCFFRGVKCGVPTVLQIHR